jgi:hypothetical protein
MVALPPKSNGDGNPRREGPDSHSSDLNPTDSGAVDVAELDRIEGALRQRLPQMDSEALERVHHRLQDELNSAERRWLWSWRHGGGSAPGKRWLNVLAAAAVVMLIAGVGVVVFLAMNKNSGTGIPSPPGTVEPVRIVVDELDVIIEQQVDPGAPPLFERPMIDLSQYQSLIGEEHVTQR